MFRLHEPPVFTSGGDRVVTGSLTPGFRSRAVGSGSTIGTRLVLLILAIAIPLIGFSAYLIYDTQAQTRQRADVEARDLANNVAAAAQEYVKGARSTLEQLARRTAIEADGRIRCDPLLQDFHALLPRYANLTVVDVAGRLVCSARPFPADRFRSVHDLPWFQEAFRYGRSAISNPRISQTTGRPSAILTYPVYGYDRAAPIAVTAFTLDLVKFPPVAGLFGHTPGAVVGIVHDNGEIVARSDDPETWVGKRVPEPLAKIVEAADPQARALALAIDGQERFFHFVRIPDTPWIAYAGILAAPLLEVERRNLLLLLLVSGVTISLAGIAAFTLARRIARPVHAIAEVARGIAAGNRDIRAPVSGPREIREVAQELNRMLEVQNASESELRQLARHLRQLSRRLLEAEEIERRNINRELHDRIGQNLSAINLNLNLIREQIGAGAPARLLARLTDTQATLDATVTSVRNVMADLRPPALDDYGLFAALHTHAEAFTARTGLPVAMNGRDIEPRLPLIVETALFRIAQEALANVAKHARARRVEVALTETPRGVTLAVTDDGIGFDPGAAESRRASWGLSTMRERADAIGAGLRVESAPGRGTRVVVGLRRDTP